MQYPSYHFRTFCEKKNFCVGVRYLKTFRNIVAQHDRRPFEFVHFTKR